MGTTRYCDARAYIIITKDDDEQSPPAWPMLAVAPMIHRLVTVISRRCGPFREPLPPSELEALAF